MYLPETSGHVCRHHRSTSLFLLIHHGLQPIFHIQDVTPYRSDKPWRVQYISIHMIKKNESWLCMHEDCAQWEQSQPTFCFFRLPCFGSWCSLAERGLTFPDRSCLVNTTTLSSSPAGLFSPLPDVSLTFGCDAFSCCAFSSCALSLAANSYKIENGTHQQYAQTFKIKQVWIIYCAQSTFSVHHTPPKVLDLISHNFCL